MTKPSNLVNYIHVIYKVLRSYPANFIKLSQLFMEMWSIETIHCLNFNGQRQKLHDVTNDVKVNCLIHGLVGCMKNMLVLFNILFFIILSICAMEYAEKHTFFYYP